MATEHLNRYVSRIATVSRRTADEMIRRGRVTVGRVPVTDPGALLDPATDEVRLDGRAIADVPEERIYLVLNKPDNVVTTMKDQEGRKTVASLVGALSSRVFPVGRLDYHTTGLLLLTNDGELAYRITHPRFGVEKTYVAKVQGIPTPGKLGVLRRGLPIEGRMTNPAEVKLLEAKAGKAWVQIRIAEGRHHQVRKMFEAIGHRAMKLRRTALGPLTVSGLDPGQWRYLTPRELKELAAYVREKEKTAQTRPPEKVPARKPERPRVERPATGPAPAVPKERDLRDRGKKRPRGAATGKEKGPPGPDRGSAPGGEARRHPDRERKLPRQPKPRWKGPGKRR